MPFQEDNALAGIADSPYGTYLTTFFGDAGQVQAHLFEQGGRLIAHVEFTPGLKPEQVTDRFVTQIQQYAAEHEYAAPPQLILADQ